MNTFKVIALCPHAIIFISMLTDRQMKAAETCYSAEYYSAHFICDQYRHR